MENLTLKNLLKPSLIIVLLVQFSISNIFVGFAQSSRQEQSYVLPDIYIDISSKLQEMSYTVENITNISSDLVNSVLLSYCQENPYGYTTERPSNFDKENFFLSDDNSVNEYDSILENSVVAKEFSPNVMTLSESKACVTCVIWEYPGGTQPGWYMQQAAYYVYNGADDYGDYDIVFTNLENSVATRDNIDTVLEYFFDKYDNVDLYFMGHGGRAYVYFWSWWQWKSYYCPYDSIDASGDLVISNVFWEYELPSTYSPWDSSPMRMVLFGACYSWEFRQEALNPGGSTSHDRAFCGFSGTGTNKYVYYFMDKWCDLWYQYSWDSSSAAAEARAYAWVNSNSVTNMSYADTGSYIYC
ncbi:MAG TPA: hypothetical protein ENN36_03570 [Candidatus Bathyarchaeota archaeon]|nr:hypothetical protein [Candidatus Bathyarchaeota archaeon]